jgi:hypothetical protein
VGESHGSFVELSPEAKLLSPTINLDRHSTSQAIQWQLTPEIKKVDFPLDTLLQLPPPTLVEHRSSITVNVPPLVTKEATTSSPAHSTLSLAASTEFNVRNRWKNPLDPVTSSQTASIIPLKAQSQLFPNPTSSSVRKVTIPPNTVFTLDLTENWHYQ